MYSISPVFRRQSLCFAVSCEKEFEIYSNVLDSTESEFYLFTAWRCYWAANTSRSQLQKRRCTALAWWVSSRSKLTGSDVSLNSYGFAKPFCWAEFWSTSVRHFCRSKSCPSGRACTGYASSLQAPIFLRRGDLGNPKLFKILTTRISYTQEIIMQSKIRQIKSENCSDFVQVLIVALNLMVTK